MNVKWGLYKIPWKKKGQILEHGGFSDHWRNREMKDNKIKPRYTYIKKVVKDVSMNNYKKKVKGVFQDWPRLRLLIQKY